MGSDLLLIAIGLDVTRRLESVSTLAVVPPRARVRAWRARVGVPGDS